MISNRSSDSLADMGETPTPKKRPRATYPEKPCIYCPEGSGFVPKSGMAARFREHCYLPEHEERWEREKTARKKLREARTSGLGDPIKQAQIERLKALSGMAEDADSEDLLMLLKQVAELSKEFSQRARDLADRISQAQVDTESPKIRGVLRQLHTALKDGASTSGWVDQSARDLAGSAIIGIEKELKKG